MKRSLGRSAAAAILFVGLAAQAQYITEFKATEAKLSGPFALTNGYISQAQATGVGEGGRAVFSFTAPAAGQYAVFAVVEASNRDARSVFISFDSEPNESASRWEVPINNGFTTNLVTTTAGAPKYFDLAKGTHQLIIRGSAPNVKLSRLSIAMRPAAPSNLHVVTGSR